jgi:hypothetical protein
MSTTFWATTTGLVKPARNKPPRFVTSLVKFRQVSRAVAPLPQSRSSSASPVLDDTDDSDDSSDTGSVTTENQAEKKRILNIVRYVEKLLKNDSYTWEPVSFYLDIQRAANENNANCRLTTNGFLIATKDVPEGQELLLPPYEQLSVEKIKGDLKTTQKNLKLFENTLDEKLTFKNESKGGFWNVLYEINTTCERRKERKGRGMGMYAQEKIKQDTVFDWILSHEELDNVGPGENEYDHDSRVARIYCPISSAN